VFIFCAFGGSLCILVGSLWQRDRYRDVLVAVLLSCFAILLSLPQRLTIALNPSTVDLALYHLDWTLFRLDALKLCIWTQFHLPRFTKLLEVVYYALPLAMGMVYALERNVRVVWTGFAAGLAAFPFYNLFPAAGPLHLSPDGIHFLSTIEGPRNCMPSLHFSWALLTALNTSNLWVRLFAWTFFALTACATIVSGEHYFIDLAVAVPFCLLIQYFVKGAH